MLLVLLLSLPVQSIAWAQDGAAVVDASDVEPLPIQLERRGVPDYDGRGDDPVTSRDILLWIPRILMSPLYVVAEYGIRQPLRFVVSRAEEAELADQVLDLFHFGPNDRFLLSPTLTFDFGLRSNIGVIFSAEDAFVDGNKLRLSYSFGGTEWHLLSLDDRYTWDDSTWNAGLRSVFQIRPDGRFWGLGSEISEAASSRFAFMAWDAEAYVERALGPGFLRVSTGVRYRSFTDETSDVEVPRISEVLAQGTISALPPGFEDGYTIHHISAQLKLDSRPERLDGRHMTRELPVTEPASGVVFTADAEFAYSLRDPSQQMWVKYGAGLRGDWDVSSANHILSLSVGMRMTESVHGEIPFTERVTLSGSGPMAGFLGDYLTGESAFDATFSYSWPIWVFLDGVAHLSVGNVFDGRFEGFAADQLRLSATVGVAALTRRDYFFEFLVGFGTETFANGASANTVRVTFGGHRDF